MSSESLPENSQGSTSHWAVAFRDSPNATGGRLLLNAGVRFKQAVPLLPFGKLPFPPILTQTLRITNLAMQLLEHTIQKDWNETVTLGDGESIGK